MIEWGAEIRKGTGPWWRDDEDRPGWLTGVVTCRLRTSEWITWEPETPVNPAEKWAWVHADGSQNITAFKLEETHPAYRAIAHNMRPWSGGESAPNDWDGGDTLRANGEMCCTAAESMGWQTEPDSVFRGGPGRRVVGYTPTTAPNVPDALVQRMVRLVRDVAEGPLFSTHVTTARAILAELEPPTLAQRLATKHGVSVETVEAILAEGPS
jgi:hypothetical protein